MEDKLIEKYFVPEISDISLGYEYETNYNREKKWEKKIVNDLYCDNEGNGELQDLLTLINYHNSDILDWKINYSNRVRVPYLTKDQIESEGWRIHNLQKEIKDKNCFLFYKKVNEETFIMVFDPSDSCKRIGIHQEVLKIPVKHFSGTCKDINTLRQIQKLLGI